MTAQRMVLALMLLSLGEAMSGFAAEPRARLTFQVVDDEGQPVAGMPVDAGFDDDHGLKGKTDANGRFVFSGRATTWELYYVLEKDGWYPTSGSYQFESEPKDGRMQPWAPVVTTVVRRVVKPVPMYARKIHTVIPDLDRSIGFDLLISDWLAPYGAGQVADLSFQMRKRYVDIRNFNSSLDIILTNSVDGLQETSLVPFKPSEFRLLRHAPTSGYVITNLHISESSTNYFCPNEQISYYLCVRTVTNHSGEISRALYGKIRGYFGFDVRREKTGTIRFTYYLNPTPNDRNLEFDPNRNLFKNLKSTEQVTEP